MVKFTAVILLTLCCFTTQGQNSGLCFQNFKAKSVALPKELHQQIDALQEYTESSFAVGSILLDDKKLILIESALPDLLLNGCCEPYESAEDLRNIREESKQETKYYLVGKVPYSSNYTSVLIIAERHWTSNCGNEKEVVLLNMKSGRVLSFVRMGMINFGSTISSMTSLKDDKAFLYQDNPFPSDVDISIEALKAAKANKELLEFTINYATFRINSNGYIEVISKGKA